MGDPTHRFAVRPARRLRRMTSSSPPRGANFVRRSAAISYDASNRLTAKRLQNRIGRAGLGICLACSRLAGRCGDSLSVSVALRATGSVPD